MPERTSYEPGTPSWVDLGTSDTDAARAFYGELFGWTADEPGPVEETGGYAMFRNDGRPAAAFVTESCDPATLEDIDFVPIPVNAATGRPFLYRLEGATAILELPASDGIPNNTRRFEIQIAS